MEIKKADPAGPKPDALNIKARKLLEAHDRAVKSQKDSPLKAPLVGLRPTA